MEVADAIQYWIVREEERIRPTHMWHWGAEMFWMAFTAAYPDLSNGEWPRWSLVIPIDGVYIKYWLNQVDSEVRGGIINSERQRLEYIWDEFQNFTSLFYTARPPL
jgi:hypothetical protein